MHFDSLTNAAKQQHDSLSWEEGALQTSKNIDKEVWI